MSKMDKLYDILAQQAVKLGWFRFTQFECGLPSGRKFRYNMTDYPFRPFATLEQIDALCRQLIRDKYRYCDWDRSHPKADTEVEIFDAVKAWMLDWVARVHRVRAKTEAGEHAEPSASADGGA